MQTFVTSNADCINANERQSADLVAAWLDKAGLPTDGAAWPLDTESAGELLRAGEYDVGDGELDRLGELRQIPKLAQWHAKDVLAAAAALECRRQWQLTPSVHDPKKTSTRLALEQFIAAENVASLVAQLQKNGHDLRLALVLLVESENRQMRETLLTTIQALLASEGIHA